MNGKLFIRIVLKIILFVWLNNCVSCLPIPNFILDYMYIYNIVIWRLVICSHYLVSSITLTFSHPSGGSLTKAFDLFGPGLHTALAGGSGESISAVNKNVVICVYCQFTVNCSSYYKVKIANWSYFNSQKRTGCTRINIPKVKQRIFWGNIFILRIVNS